MRRASGFSLIEMLAVLFVVVMIIGLVSLNVNSGVSDRELQQKVEGLMAVVDYALDEAQFSGSDFGLLFTLELDPRGERRVRARWREYLPQGWRDPQSSAEIFEDIEFEPTLELSLRLDNVDIPLEEPNDREDERNNPPAPQWLFTSSGETLPGELVLRDLESGDSVWRLEWDALGRFDVYRGDDVDTYEADVLAFSR